MGAYPNPISSSGCHCWKKGSWFSFYIYNELQLLQDNMTISDLSYYLTNTFSLNAEETSYDSVPASRTRLLRSNPQSPCHCTWSGWGPSRCRAGSAVWTTGRQPCKIFGMGCTQPFDNTVRFSYMVHGFEAWSTFVCTNQFRLIPPCTLLVRSTRFFIPLYIRGLTVRIKQ